jgi:capsular polysaccharide biosynthesis protein
LNEDVLDLAGSWRIVRARWRTCLAFAAVALLVWGVYLHRDPPPYTASSEVLLPGVTNAGPTAPGNDMSTAKSIATSAAVLGPAGHSVDPSLSLAQLQNRVKASGIATNVLKITVSERAGARAVALANAVADQLVTFETTNAATANANLTALQANAAQLTGQIRDIDGQIDSTTAQLRGEDPLSNAAQQHTDALQSLNDDKNKKTTALNDVNGQIAQAKQAGQPPGQGAQVIQHATAAKAPSFTSKAYRTLIALVLGLLVGAGYVLVRHRRDRRLYHRDQLADVLGVPVFLSMSAPRSPQRSRAWIRLFGQYLPTSNDRWSMRQLLHELEPDGAPTRLVVLALAGDSAGLAAAPQMAIVTAVLGLATDFVTGSHHEFSKELRSACAQLAVFPDGPRPNLRVWPTTPPDVAHSAAAVVVRSLVVDAAHPTLPRIEPRATVLLAVSAGFETAEHLARVALAATDAGAPISGVVLTNPEPDDSTTGRFPVVAPRAAPGAHGPRLASGGDSAS